MSCGNGSECNFCNSRVVPDGSATAVTPSCGQLFSICRKRLSRYAHVMLAGLTSTVHPVLVLPAILIALISLQILLLLSVS